MLKEYSTPSMFWIDPDANLHKVPYLGHWDTGKDILIKKYGVSLEDADKDVYTKMSEHGWFRVAFVSYQGKNILEYDVPRIHKPSARQIKSIKDFAIEIGADEVVPLKYD